VKARLSWFYNDTGIREKGITTCDEALQTLRQHDSTEDLIAALFSRGLIAYDLRQWDIAVNSDQEGLGIAQSLGDKYWEGHFLVWLGMTHHILDDLASAFRCAEGALAIFQDVETHYGNMIAQVLMGNVEESRHVYVAAKNWYQQSLMQAEAFGHAHIIGILNTYLGRIANYEQNYSVSRVHLLKALQVLWAAYKSLKLALPLVHIARLFADQNEVDKAVEILAILDKHSLRFGDTDEMALALHDEFETKLGPERFTAAWVRGEKRELSAMVTELLAELADD
jgi:tetratricopeptide (TPR) repeat protein